MIDVNEMISNDLSVQDAVNCLQETMRGPRTLKNSAVRRKLTDISYHITELFIFFREI